MIKYKTYQSFWDPVHKINYIIIHPIIKENEVYYKVSITTRFRCYRIILSERGLEKRVLHITPRNRT